jgi:hypothetical protein
MCEVLGPSQRQWLKAQLASSSAPLRIIASSSVLAGSLGYSTEEETCSGDDWEVRGWGPLMGCAAGLVHWQKYNGPGRTVTFSSILVAPGITHSTY